MKSIKLIIGLVAALIIVGLLIYMAIKFSPIANYNRIKSLENRIEILELEG